MPGTRPATPSNTPAVPAYGEDDEAEALAAPKAPAKPVAPPLVKAVGTTETDIASNVAEATARAAKP